MGLSFNGWLKMKAVLIYGHNHNQSVQIVDVKETEKSYMLDGERFKKISTPNGCIGVKRSQSAWGSDQELYNIDSEYAKRKLQETKNKRFALNVKRAAEKKIKEAKNLGDFKKLNEALNLNIEL